MLLSVRPTFRHYRRFIQTAGSSIGLLLTGTANVTCAAANDVTVLFLVVVVLVNRKYIFRRKHKCKRQWCFTTALLVSSHLRTFSPANFEKEYNEGEESMDVLIGSHLISSKVEVTSESD